MNVGNGNEATQFHFYENINRIFVTVCYAMEMIFLGRLSLLP
jgi:hypothetical protein